MKPSESKEEMTEEHTFVHKLLKGFHWVLLHLIIPAIIAAAVLWAWTYYGIRHFERYPSRIVGGIDNKAADAAAYGDSFGYVNALFSGLAFGGVIYAIILQTIELRLQRKEIEENREELRRTADANTNLVRLNALATLSRFYFGIIDRNNASVINEFNDTLRNEPDRVTQTVRFKLDNCISMLESLYGEVTGQSISPSPVNDTISMRRKLWHEDFLFDWNTFGNYWRTIDTEEFSMPEKQVIHKKDMIARLESFVEHSERTTLRYTVVLGDLEDSYRDKIETARNEARRLAEKIRQVGRVDDQDWSEGKAIFDRLSELARTSTEFQRTHWRQYPPTIG